MRPSSEDQVEEWEIRYTKAKKLATSCKINFRQTDIGTKAKGAVIGIPTKHHCIRFLCSPCLSVPKTLKTSRTFSSGINDFGNETSTFPFPDNSSAFLRAESG